MSNVSATEPGVGQSGTDSDTGSLLLFWTILRMNLLLMVRYRLNFVAQIVAMYLFFGVIFFGGSAVAQRVGGMSALGGTFDAVIVGWFLWTMVQSAYASLSSEITQESRWGTLEQLYMSPHGFGRILGMKILANTLLSVMMGLVMLFLMLVTTGRSLALNFVTIIPITVLTLLAAVGIGYMFAGLALVYKRVSNVSQLAQFGLLGLIAAPAADVPLLKLLPLAQGSSMLQQSMRAGVQLWEFAPLDIAILLVTGVGYLIAGHLVFMFCLTLARKRGVMGHY